MQLKEIIHLQYTEVCFFFYKNSKIGTAFINFEMKTFIALDTRFKIEKNHWIFLSFVDPTVWSCNKFKPMFSMKNI